MIAVNKINNLDLFDSVVDYVYHGNPSIKQKIAF